MPKCGVWHYLVYTYDGNHNNNVYCDGALYNSARSGTLATFVANPRLLGAQSDSGGGQIGTGQPLTGSIAAVRVGSGALNTSDILNNYLEGPDASAPGSIKSISLTVPPLYYGGFSAPTVSATFATKTNINVSRVAAIVSGSTNVVQVLADNSLQAVSHGSATITASFLGVQSVQTVAVVNTLPPHNWSIVTVSVRHRGLPTWRIQWAAPTVSCMAPQMPPSLALNSRCLAGLPTPTAPLTPLPPM